MTTAARLRLLAVAIWLACCGMRVGAQAQPSKPAPQDVLVNEHAPEYADIVMGLYARYHALDGKQPHEEYRLQREWDQQGRPRWFDGPHGAFTLSQLSMRLMANGQVDDLERLLNDMANGQQRMADGRWKLMPVMSGLSERFAGAKDWHHDVQVIERWRAKYPESGAAATVEAFYWTQYAWDARGTGYIQSVTKEAYAIFLERLQHAESVLKVGSKNARQFPPWYQQYLIVARGLDWPRAVMLDLFGAAVKAFPDYPPFYFTTVVNVTPKWGGSWLAVDTFVDEAARADQGVDGEILYARLYWLLAQDGGVNFDLFRATHASWPRMKKGFEQMMRAYPHSAWNLNNFAAFACRAGDRKTFNDLRARMGDVITPEAWTGSYSLDVCVRPMSSPS
jgi:hypothetical protein